MIVPTEIRPRTTHTVEGSCWCDHTHTPAPAVLKGPAGRASQVGYVVTDGRLYQQVHHLDAIHLETGEMLELFGIVRTVGTIGR